MKNLKVIVCLLVVAILSLSMVACGRGEEKPAATFATGSADSAAAVTTTAEESKAQNDTENSVAADTNTSETASAQSVGAPAVEEGDLEIMTAPSQHKEENQNTDSAQEETQAETQTEAETPDRETSPQPVPESPIEDSDSQKETYIELPFIPAE